MSPTPSRVEEFQVTGAQLVSSVKDLIHQGNIRRISIRNADGVTLLRLGTAVHQIEAAHQKTPAGTVSRPASADTTPSSE